MSRSTRSPAELALLALTLLARWWRLARQTARLAIGLPDYDVYAAHMRRVHPDVAPMDRDTFFRERMEARYGKGRSRCC
jgi:uncharacterized short protein YbdD (DUF466 family)